MTSSTVYYIQTHSSRRSWWPDSSRRSSGACKIFSQTFINKLKNISELQPAVQIKLDRYATVKTLIMQITR